MANKVFIDNILDPATGDQGFFLGMNTDQCYPGMDLSLKFAEEIKGYTSVWKWIQARIKAGNFYGIHVGDYIPFNCTNSAKTRIVAVVAGIDTYYKYGDQQVGHHIDFISKDLWPTYIQYNLANFNNGLIPVEKLSGDGSKTEFVLTKQMDSIDNIIVGSDQVTGYQGIFHSDMSHGDTVTDCNCRKYYRCTASHGNAQLDSFHNFVDVHVSRYDLIIRRNDADQRTFHFFLGHSQCVEQGTLGCLIDTLTVKITVHFFHLI